MSIIINLGGAIGYYNDYDQLHCEDGPAIVYANGSKEWYLEGIEYSEQEFDKIILKYKWNKFVKDHHKI